MPLPEISRFTVVVLTKALRESGLATGGTKAELIQRLREGDPDAWCALEMRRGVPCPVDVPTEDVNCGMEVAEMGAGASTEARQENVVLPGSEELDERMELMLLRREEELWGGEREERERARYVLLRERNLERCASAANVGTAATGSVVGRRHPEY